MGVSAAPAAMPVRAQIPPGLDQGALAVARMVAGIISYSRWPGDLAVVRLCVMGDTRFADRLGDAKLPAGPPIAAHRIAAGSVAANSCDVLYLGQMKGEDMRRSLAGIRGLGVLSIAEQDPECRGGSMFCLMVGSHTLSFQLNIDAISRGTVRVDPRVLRLAQRPENVS